MTKQTVTALFDDYPAAMRAVERLKSLGIRDEDISILGRNGNQAPGSVSESNVDHTDDGDGAVKGASVGAALGGGAGLLTGLGMLAIPGVGPVVAAGWLAATLAGAVAGGATGGLLGALTDAGVPEEEAHHYAEGVRRGGTLVSARLDDQLVAQATDVLDDEGSVKMGDRSAEWRSEGWKGQFEPRTSGLAENPTAARNPDPNRARSSMGSDRGSVPVVEEELKVGKQDQTRQVRVTPKVTDRATEKDVTLHDERVEVVTRPVDRPATAEDIARQGQSIETTERKEIPIVEKQARVVAEVSLDKVSEERKEKVRDTVRRTGVEVEDEHGNKVRKPTHRQ